MATIGTLAVNIVARTDKFTRGISKAQGALGRLSSTAIRASKSVAAFGAASVVAGGAIGTYLVKQQFDAVDSLAKVADKLGIATDKLAGLRLAAEETGAGARTLEMGLQRMVRRISEAAGGSGEAVSALQELGLSAAVLNRLSPDQQFERIAGAMSRVNNQSDRIRLAFKLFDSEGVALVNTLKLGRSGLAEVQSFAERAGLAVSRKMAAAIERANDAFGRLKTTVTGLMRQLAVRLAPLMEKVSSALSGILTSDGRIQTLANGIMQAVGQVVTGAIKAVHSLRIAMGDAKVAFMQMSLQVSQSPLGRAMGLGVDQKTAAGIQGAILRDGLQNERLRSKDPALEFALWFQKHLGDAMREPDTPAKKLGASLMSSLRERVMAAADTASASLGALGRQLDGVESAARGAALNRLLGQLTFGLLGSAGPRPSVAAAGVGALSATRSNNRILERGTREAALAARGGPSRDYQKTVADNTKEANRLLRRVARNTEQDNAAPFPVAGLN